MRRAAKTEPQSHHTHWTVRFLTVRAPSAGHPGPGRRPWTIGAASWGTSLVYSRMRSTFTVSVAEQRRRAGEGRGGEEKGRGSVLRGEGEGWRFS